jgi:RHS repeat-associated protein
VAKAEASVEELVGMIERGELRLPEMQRRYVWRSTRVRDLLDSLYRGYPSGAILLWETDEAVPLQDMAVTQKTNPYQSTRLLLDGQQRLTSLSAVIRGESVKVRGRKKPIELLFNLEHPDQLGVVTEVDEEGGNDDEEDDLVDDEADSSEDELQKRFDRMTFVVTTRKTSSTDGEGVTLTNTYNAGARLTSVTSSMSDSNHPGTLFGKQNIAHYNAAGSLTSVTLGNNISETRTYDGRLRLCAIQDGSNGSIYSLAIPSTPTPCPTGSSGYAPNSDVVAANDSVNGNWAYGYDALNRLVSSSQSSGATTYSYADDRFGNRWSQTVTHGSGTPSSLGFDANNHITASFSVTYDAAGDTTYDGTTTYTYDAEHRVITASNGTSGSSSYVYDANGRRTQKTTSAGGTVNFLYDLGGHEIVQMTSTGTWTRGEVYADGSHLATYLGGSDGATYFIHSDWQDTERVRSNVSGASCETITSLPFGDAMTTSGSCGDPSPMHFTGKEHDSETNLENFGARFDASSMGRFMTPDWSGNLEPVPYADYSEPQSLDLYAYLENNPLSRIDSGGHSGDLPLSGKYTVRFDKNNQNDYPNIHIKKSGNEVARGKIMPDGHVEWAPTNVGANILEQARQKAIQKGYQQAAIERQKHFDELKAAREGGLTGSLSEMSSVLMVGDLILSAYYEHQTEQNEPKTGWHYDALVGQIEVTNVDKAGQSLPVGSSISFGSDTYTLGNDGKWRDSHGNYLFQCHNGKDICSSANAV